MISLIHCTKCLFTSTSVYHFCHTGTFFVRDLTMFKIYLSGQKGCEGLYKLIILADDVCLSRH